MNLNKLEYRGFQIHYKNEFEVKFLINEIFENNAYSFYTSKEDPFIIDCGSHIGISVLYFKKTYPRAKIIAFEPDPISYGCLKQNIEVNHLTEVICCNIALSDSIGSTHLYGDFSDNSESVGNSIIPGWGQRDRYSQKVVATDKLSRYLNQEIDLLKLDVEGAEQNILNDIHEKLSYIKNIYLEQHQFNRASNQRNLKEVINDLQNLNYIVTHSKEDLFNLLKNKYPVWANEQRPIIHKIKAHKHD